MSRPPARNRSGQDHVLDETVRRIAGPSAVRGAWAPELLGVASRDT
ncbi:hypothetical protein [Streptomyces sp. NPDC002343]